MKGKKADKWGAILGIGFWVLVLALATAMLVAITFVGLDALKGV